MFSTFPEDARWTAERQAVEFGVEIGEYQGVVRVPRRVGCSWNGPPPSSAQRRLPPANPLESIVEPKLHRRQMAEDSNVEISGRDLRERSR
jgi:hypothetical protein